MHLSCFVLCHEVPSIRFPSANRLISSVLDDCMLQTVSLYVIVYSVRSSTSLEQSTRTSVQCLAISCPANRLTQNTTQDLFQRCRDLDKTIDFLALVTLMGHLDGCSWIYEKPFQSESHYFFQSVLLMSARSEEHTSELQSH